MYKALPPLAYNLTAFCTVKYYEAVTLKEEFNGC